MSPAELSVLIHCHAIAEPLRESEVNGETVKWFLQEQIIEPYRGYSGNQFTTTDRGKKWLEMILDTPMPIHQWVDPRGPK